VDYFALQPLSDRKLVELPYALRQLESWKELRSALCQPDMFVKMYNDDVNCYELINYLKDIDEAFLNNKWKRTIYEEEAEGAPLDTKVSIQFLIAICLANMDVVSGGIFTSVSKFESSTSDATSAQFQRKLAFVYYNAAELLRELARHGYAEQLYMKAASTQSKLYEARATLKTLADEPNQVGQTLAEEYAATLDGP